MAYLTKAPATKFESCTGRESRNSREAFLLQILFWRSSRRKHARLAVTPVSRTTKVSARRNVGRQPNSKVVERVIVHGQYFALTGWTDGQLFTAWAETVALAGASMEIVEQDGR